MIAHIFISAFSESHFLTDREIFSFSPQTELRQIEARGCCMRGASAVHFFARLYRPRPSFSADAVTELLHE